MRSFFELGVKEHLGLDNQLVKLEKIINWNNLLVQLDNVHKEEGSKGYNSLKIFRAILLSQWHSLSDPGLEQSLRARLNLLQFYWF
jgi:IS5 family transposase